MKTLRGVIVSSGHYVIVRQTINLWQIRGVIVSSGHYVIVRQTINLWQIRGVIVSSEESNYNCLFSDNDVNNLTIIYDISGRELKPFSRTTPLILLCHIVLKAYPARVQGAMFDSRTTTQLGV